MGTGAVSPEPSVLPGHRAMPSRGVAPFDPRLHPQPVRCISPEHAAATARSLCPCSLRRWEGGPHFTDMALGPEKPLVQGLPADLSGSTDQPAHPPSTAPSACLLRPTLSDRVSVVNEVSRVLAADPGAPPAGPAPPRQQLLTPGSKHRPRGPCTRWPVADPHSQGPARSRGGP